jgi:hypothetical protein
MNINRVAWSDPGPNRDQGPGDPSSPTRDPTTAVYVLEWALTPTDYFEEPVDFECNYGSIHVENDEWCNTKKE